MAGHLFQMLTIGAFTLTRNEAGLFAIASAFGLGFSSNVPLSSYAAGDNRGT